MCTARRMVHNPTQTCHRFATRCHWPSFNQKFTTGLFSEHFSPLRSHHSFTIRYSLGEDTGPLTSLPTKPPKPLTNALDLSTHRDDSDITLNVPTPRTPLAAIVPALYLLQVCLGKQFTGGSLFFCNTGVPSFDFKHPMQMPPTFDFQHEVGTAVVHLGRLQHGNPPLTSLFISAKNLNARETCRDWLPLCRVAICH